MKMKKVTKVAIALLVALMLCMSFAGVVNATDITLSDYTEQSVNASAAGQIYNVIGPIFDAARLIGIGVALIILVVLGIQYVAASPEGKAEIKKHLTPYILGVVIILAAVALLSIIQSFASSFNTIS